MSTVEVFGFVGWITSSVVYGARCQQSKEVEVLSTIFVSTSWEGRR